MLGKHSNAPKPSDNHEQDRNLTSRRHYILWGWLCIAQNLLNPLAIAFKDDLARLPLLNTINERQVDPNKLCLERICNERDRIAWCAPNHSEQISLYSSTPGSSYSNWPIAIGSINIPLKVPRGGLSHLTKINGWDWRVSHISSTTNTLLSGSLT